MSPSHSPGPSPYFDEFQFFNPDLFPSPPPLPSSVDLFSPSETDDLFGFLENINWEFEQEPQNAYTPSAPYQFDTQSASSSSQRSLTVPDTPSAQGILAVAGSHPDAEHSRRASPQSPSASPSPIQTLSESVPPPRVKPLLSTPQKRINHIMSEQKRRNAIRDGYLQLTSLLAPAGAPPGTGMPTRGRPKGSGSRGRGTKGKSGILFKARECINWLEDGREALLAEVLKVEAAAGIRYPQ